MYNSEHKKTHFLDLPTTPHSAIVRGLPEVTLDENHGGSKKYKKLRYRRMVVRWIDLDHRYPRLLVVGTTCCLPACQPACLSVMSAYFKT